MLAGQLLSIAEDILADYERLRVIETLREAVNLASDRPNLTENQFQVRVAPLVSAAQKISEGTIVRAYPIELKRTLSQSNYSQSLPNAIANIILAGFANRTKKSSISSAEVNMYLEEALAFQQAMISLVHASKAFGITHYVPPEDLVPLEIRIPDRVYERSLGELPEKLKHVEAALNVVEELVTGSRSSHKILWMSTTDLTVAIPLAATVVWGALCFYEKLLDVVIKQMEVAKLIRDVRKLGGPHDDVESRVKATVDAALKEAISDIVKQIAQGVGAGRQQELMTELTSAARPLINDISAGMRFATDARHQRDLLIHDDGPDVPNEAIQRLEARQTLEMRIDNHLKTFSEEDALLLISQQNDPETLL